MNVAAGKSCTSEASATNISVVLRILEQNYGSTDKWQKPTDEIHCPISSHFAIFLAIISIFYTKIVIFLVVGNKTVKKFFFTNCIKICNKIFSSDLVNFLKKKIVLGYS